jgi:LacI family transcriptional regulator
MSSTATIAEIAARAGVGTATVDRVLNKRPGVNADTVQRVLQVVAEIGTPPLRGRPRRDANLRFAFVLPADDTPFLELVDRQIAQSAGDFRHQHITEVTYRLDAGDGEQFAASLAQVAECEGVALMAPDLPPVKLAINELVRSGVHVVTLFSDVAGSMRETHVGADSRAAGRTAGLLLGRMASGSPRLHFTARHCPGDALSAEIERRIGFMRCRERFPSLRTCACRTCRRATRRRGARSRASCRRVSIRSALPASTTSAREAPGWRARSPTPAWPRSSRWPRTT